MKSKILFWLSGILLSMSFYSQAQDNSDYYQMEGKVVDSLNQSIPYANVLLKDTTSNEIKSFAVTDGDGRFKMTVKAGSALQLRASFVGYVPFVRNIVTDSKSVQNLIITLSQDEGMLNEVQVVKEMPVTLSGDTLIYKTEAFTNGKERKLEDVLKKLPGVEVDVNGNITVQGKKVNKLMVEGKQFFDGDSKMAVKNLPAKAIDRIQVLKGYQDNAALKNVSTSENIVMNITLKEDQKSLVFGDVTLGGGNQDSYAGHGNAFYYSENLSVNTILDANNIGEQAFSYSDFQRMKQAQNTWAIQRGALQIEESNHNNMIPRKDKTQVQSLTSSFAGLNIAYQPSQKWIHQAYVIANQSDLFERQEQQRRFLSETAPDPENSSTVNNQMFGNILGQYQLDYLASSVSNWQYKSQWLGGKSIAERTISSDWSGGQESDINNQSNEWSWNQQLNYYTQLNPNHIISFENQFLWRSSDGVDVWDLLYGTTNEVDSTLLRTEQRTQDIKTLQSELHYYWIFNRRNHLDISLSYQNRTATIDRTLQDEADEELPDYKMDFNRLWSNAAMGIQWKSKIGGFLFLPGVSLFHLNDQRISFRSEEEQKFKPKQYLLPNLSVQYKINSVQGVNLVFNQEVRSPQSEWLSEAMQLRSYQNILIGNPMLRPAFYNRWQLNYHFFNLFSGMNAFAFLSYNQVQHSFQEATSFESRINNSELFNSGEPQHDVQYNAKVDKRFKAFRLTLESNGLYQSYVNQVNKESLENEQWSQNHSLAFQTNVGKYISSTVKYGYQLTEYANGPSNNQFNLQRIENRWDFQWHDAFEFHFDLEYQVYEGTNTNSNWWLANTELSYQFPKAPLRLDFQVFNIFNTQSTSRDFLSEYFVSTYQNYIQGRRALLKVNYSF